MGGPKTAMMGLRIVLLTVAIHYCAALPRTAGEHRMGDGSLMQDSDMPSLLATVPADAHVMRDGSIMKNIEMPSLLATVQDSVTPTPELLVAKQVLEVPSPATDKPGLKTDVDAVVSEDKLDEAFVEVDAKSQAKAKSKAKSKSKSKSKMGYSHFGSFCDDSRRRRDDESPRKGDPDCSGTDCQQGMSRRRRSDDCAAIDACFPASALVETETRGAVQMKEVLLGERIQTADGFSEVSCP